jgi:hypothetical protein
MYDEYAVAEASAGDRGVVVLGLLDEVWKQAAQASAASCSAWLGFLDRVVAELEQVVRRASHGGLGGEHAMPPEHVNKAETPTLNPLIWGSIKVGTTVRDQAKPPRFGLIGNNSNRLCSR